MTLMCGSTSFGRLPAHHQEHTTALGASAFTVAEKITCQTTTKNAPAASLQCYNQRLLVQLYAPDDGREDTRNILSHT